MRQLNANPYIDANYSATFEQGTGTISVTLKKQADDWKFTSFRVNSPIFEQDIAMATCPSCGNAHTANAGFCPSCGMELDEKKVQTERAEEASTIRIERRTKQMQSRRLLIITKRLVRDLRHFTMVAVDRLFDRIAPNYIWRRKCPFTIDEIAHDFVKNHIPDYRAIDLHSLRGSCEENKVALAWHRRLASIYGIANDFASAFDIAPSQSWNRRLWAQYASWESGDLVEHAYASVVELIRKNNAPP